ncbi:unnamed protein product [Phytophthora fragariaefolia]|uniref:Unnamed protein product n=1 Tax=Phytophthora fragariaefolia TaxID=1490495 RepID=A0A9W6YDX0_9STRA|nr:unnamed protein product [Phytophthora fragariaefolia]
MGSDLVRMDPPIDIKEGVHDQVSLRVLPGREQRIDSTNQPHGESQDDAQLSNGSGDDASTEIGSPASLLNARSTDQPSAGWSSADGTADDPAMDLEEKPRFPPQVPSGNPADFEIVQDPPDEGSSAKTKKPSSTNTTATRVLRPRR